MGKRFPADAARFAAQRNAHPAQPAQTDAVRMLTLRRTVRCSLLPTIDGAEDPLRQPRHNPHAGWPTAHGANGVGAFCEIEVEVRGEPDPVTGYLINITLLDAAVREHAIGWLTARFGEQFTRSRPIDPATTTVELARRIATGLIPTFAALPGRAVRAITWRITPAFSHRFDFTMPDSIEIRQRFEFSASHRLHCPSLDDATNRALFGKCNSPNGHGHNYEFEVAVSLPLAEAHRFPVGTFDRVVDETIIRRFDHKHLNLDVPEFASLNPSVEHIAKVCHDLLRPALAPHGAALTSVTVWETEKTSCTYPSRA